MIDDANAAGVKIFVQSAYRSFFDQASLKGKYTVTYGAGTANSFSADQGYSEHQLGTTVDFSTTGLNGGLDGFDKTPAYTWLVANAYKYGFVLSYPKNNTYYVFEPWHWRFVGFALALRIHNESKNFYDLDQRVIDGYLISIFDQL
jgi:D-alanyl-D-alanine carboxypeptidase